MQTGLTCTHAARGRPVPVRTPTEVALKQFVHITDAILQAVIASYSQWQTVNVLPKDLVHLAELGRRTPR